MSSERWKETESVTGKHDDNQLNSQILIWTKTCDKKNKSRIIVVNNDEIISIFHNRNRDDVISHDQYTGDNDTDRNVSYSVPSRYMCRGYLLSTEVRSLILTVSNSDVYYSFASFFMCDVCIVTHLISSFCLSWLRSWRYGNPRSRISVKDT